MHGLQGFRQHSKGFGQCPIRSVEPLKDSEQVQDKAFRGRREYRKGSGNLMWTECVVHWKQRASLTAIPIVQVRSL